MFIFSDADWPFGSALFIFPELYVPMYSIYVCSYGQYLCVYVLYVCV